MKRSRAESRRRTGRALPFDAIVPAPFGALGVKVSDGALVGVDFLPGESLRPCANSEFAERAAGVLAAYLRDARVPLNLPVAPQGTLFQRRVWQTMVRIPRGQTRAYGELARELGSSARAVGGACGANPVVVVIPCHRVVAAHGLGGFSGATDGHWLEVKRWLLNHEGVPGLGA